ncbi:MAG: asparaginase [Candidatus Eremiobacteraeota bacterium]|nr:asparaginase [Candidatus Eremiobacteraeota bacterium]
MSLRAEIVVEVTRGNLVESVHRVAACAVDVRGNVLSAAGDVDVPVYLRSAAKPFIAAAAIEAGVDTAFGLDGREIAVMTASHSGEPIHVEAVRSILEKIGMSVADLQCGVHWPYDETAAELLRRAGEQPTALHNNCSGKHAGILALCKVIGADTASYLELTNPAEQRILELCARVSDDDASAWPLGVDGCGIPVYATSLRNAARSFARLATLEDLSDADARALAIVREAMVSYPAYVAGTRQLDTELMEAGAGSIVSKGGAEGVHGVAAIDRRFGYVSKVLDGASRARGPSSMAMLRRLGALDGAQLQALDRFTHPKVYNRAGHAIGEIRAAL